MLRRTSIALVTTALVVGIAPTADAATVTIQHRWRNCDTTQAGMGFNVKFNDPVRYYGKGKYMIKSTITWDRYLGTDRWAQSDRHYYERPWTQINNPTADFQVSSGDRTTWRSTYYRRWRVKVKVQLIKNRPGPRDKKVEEVTREFSKAQLTELGKDCGVMY